LRALPALPRPRAALEFLALFADGGAAEDYIGLHWFPGAACAGGRLPDFAAGTNSTPAGMKYRPLDRLHGFQQPLLRRLRAAACVPLALAAAFLLAQPALAATTDEGEALLNAGKYDECIAMSGEAIERLSWLETWRHLKIRSELATGRYADALVETALERFPASIRLRLLGRDVMLVNNRPQDARRMLDEIDALTNQQQWRFTDPSNRVALGRFFLLRGGDARQVLETIYDRVQRDRPTLAEPYLATGELALAKHDYQLAAEAFGEAAKLTPQDPAAHYGLARAYAASAPEEAAAALAKALELNPNHADSLLFAADRLIDSEQYAEARKMLDKVLAVNLSHPEGWAYRAVVAHLEGDAATEETCRQKALKPWPTNPQVDHLIGKKLSQKYRFDEGAAHQRRAMLMDPDHLAAKMQLAEDLLRLGREEEGLRLAQEVHQKDGYNVAAYNLVTLEENLRKFTTLQADGIVLRMDPREAAIFGQAALELLQEAKRKLCEQYDVRLDGPVTVEIFPEQKDFAVRTFGMPGGEGFLGVCFGNVITAGSPAAHRAGTSNWKAVLWHEFCHAVTLHKTRNRMPRWLSEGISVYEERRRDPAWGQSMNSRYRRMILAGELLPVSRLSGAFLDPPSPEYLEFAYFESALVVEYLIEKHGLETLCEILDDLAGGQPLGGAPPIDRVLDERVGSLGELDEAFTRFAVARAGGLAPRADWSPPELAPEADLSAVEAFCREHPNNLAGLELLAGRLVDAERWQDAKEPLEKLIELYPANTGGESPYRLLVEVHRRLGETEAEASVLEELARRDAAAIDACGRLMELCEAAEDWEGLARAADRMLAVNPLVPAGHRGLLEPARAMGKPERAVGAYRALVEMDPVDPAGLHHDLAEALMAAGDLKSARRHVLMALEEAPRFRAAHRTLLEIVEQREDGDGGPSAPQPQAPPEKQPELPSPEVAR
jgi:tetratricopeptide (TPR) repeat protein